MKQREQRKRKPGQKAKSRKQEYTDLRQFSMLRKAPDLTPWEAERERNIRARVQKIKD